METKKEIKYDQSVRLKFMLNFYLIQLSMLIDMVEVAGLNRDNPQYLTDAFIYAERIKKEL
jgi:hypothetical protein